MRAIKKRKRKPGDNIFHQYRSFEPTPDSCVKSLENSFSHEKAPGSVHPPSLEINKRIWHKWKHNERTNPCEVHVTAAL